MIISKKILLIGGKGTLGTEFIKSKIYSNIYSPSKYKFNLLNKQQMLKNLFSNKFSLIINCGAIARMKICEKKPNIAIKTNIEGTFNLVNAILEYEQKTKKKIKLIQISSDGVYPSTSGNYKEDSELGPYNNYGWTKLASEFIARIVKNHIIVRLRFFNKNRIKFKFSASDIYTSQIEVAKVPEYVAYLIKDNFKGIINIGGNKKSDFEFYKKYRKNLKKLKKKDLKKKLSFNIATNASLNLSKFLKIKKKYEQNPN